MYKHKVIIRKRKANGKYQPILTNRRIYAEYDNTDIPAKVLLNFTVSDLSQAKQTIDPGVHFITLCGGPYSGRDFEITGIDHLPRNPHRLILSITPIQSEFVTDGFIEGVVKELHPPKKVIHYVKENYQSTKKEEN